MSSNTYPRRLTRKLISQFSPSTASDNLNTENVNADNNRNLKKVWIPLPYIENLEGLIFTNAEIIDKFRLVIAFISRISSD